MQNGRHSRPYKHMTSAAEAKAIHQLVAAVQRRQGIGKAALPAAQAAEQAAQTVEAALRAVDTRWDTVENTRRIRDDIGQTWDMTLAALKRGARAAAADGAPGLYTALFGRPSRSTKKTVTSTPRYTRRFRKAITRSGRSEHCRRCR